MVKPVKFVKVYPRTHSELLRISQSVDLPIPKVMDLFTNEISRYDFKATIRKVKRKQSVEEDLGFDNFI